MVGTATVAGFRPGPAAPAGRRRLEDALVLAELLATRVDWGAGGAEYEGRRRARVEHVQAMTDRLSRAARIPTWIRDRILPVIGPRTYRETFEPLTEPVTTG